MSATAARWSTASPEDLLPGFSDLFAMIETRTFLLAGDEERWEFLSCVIRCVADSVSRRHPDWSADEVLRTMQVFVRCIRLRLGALEAMPLSANGTIGRA